MAWSNWKLVSTQSTSGYFGGAAVVGGGKFVFSLSDGRGTNYEAIYTGAGAGLGIGLDVDTGRSRIGPAILDYYLPAVRALINSVASQDLYLSGLYRLTPTELNPANLNRTLFIISLGGEIGAGFSGSLLAWEDITETFEISPQMARLGEMTPTRRPRTTALAVAVGLGVGLVGASGTVTVCACNRFAAG